MKSDDMALVREFAASQSEPAFAALVQRHLGLVHSAALRQVGDAHLAEEIAQAVFIILARKAPALRPKTILSAWLYRTTRYAAADALKARRRRQAREQEAHMQSTLNQPDADTWAQLAPLLDDAMAQLGETDRAALVLRYFENKTMREIAGALRMEEAAAQKRVARALEKLRALFAKRGVTLSATIIAGAVTANSVQAAPIGLATTVVATSVKGSVVAASITALVKGTLNIMAWIKTKTVIALGVGTLLAGAAVLTMHEQRQQNREQEQKVRAEEQQIREQAQQPGLSAEERQKLEDRLKQLRAEQGQLRAAGDKLRQQEADLFRRSSAWLSPFTKVRFDGDKVLVTYSGAEYELATINDVTTAELLDFCRTQYKYSWQIRVAEDLVVVLDEMKHPVNAEQTVSLTLIDTKTGVKTNIEHAAMTAENRRAVKNALVLDRK
jgi:RNA polymerase sigma factor (sigma-70 family)